MVLSIIPGFILLSLLNYRLYILTILTKQVPFAHSTSLESIIQKIQPDSSGLGILWLDFDQRLSHPAPEFTLLLSIPAASMSH